MKRMAKISIFPHVLFRNKIEIGADLHAWSPRGDCKSSVAENPVDRAKVKKETALLNTKIAGISAFCFLFILNELSKKPQHKTTTLNSPSPPQMRRCPLKLIMTYEWLTKISLHCFATVQRSNRIKFVCLSFQTCRQNWLFSNASLLAESQLAPAIMPVWLQKKFF